jgi:hypothetical protein
VDPDRDSLNPDVAAELRLLRAEITAIRTQPPPHPHHPHVRLPRFDPAGHLIIPRHHRLAGKPRAWLHLRAHAGPLPHAKISKQRRTALWLTAFAAARVAVWAAAMTVLVLYAAGLRGTFVAWFVHLSSLVVWVSFISYYCNAATDFATFTAGLAALFSADSHAAVITAGTATSASLDTIESDIARLADLQPGPEAAALADSIRRQLAGR